MVITLPLLLTVRKVYTLAYQYTHDMGDTKRMGIKEIRAALGQRIDAAFYLGETTTLTKNNQDRAAIVPMKFLDELAELRAEVKALRAQVKAAK